MQLLLDIGNTRIKWATIDAGEMSVASALAHAGLGVDQLSASIFRSISTRPRRVLVANVAGAAIAERVTAAIQAHWTITPSFIQASAAAGHIRSGYEKPEQLGVDRWLGAISAYDIAKSAVCIASIGTAMTVDAVDATGQHLGGIIVPGPELAVNSLLTNTSDLLQRSETGSVHQTLFADNTLGALRQGAAHALAAVIERAHHDLGARAGQDPLLVITGGASDQVTGALRIPFRVVPDLVLRGLAAIANTGDE